MVTLFYTHSPQHTAVPTYRETQEERNTLFKNALLLRRRKLFIALFLLTDFSASWRATHDGSRERKKCCCIATSIIQPTIWTNVVLRPKLKTHFKLHLRLNNYSNLATLDPSVMCKSSLSHCSSQEIKHAFFHFCLLQVVMTCLDLRGKCHQILTCPDKFKSNRWQSVWASAYMSHFPGTDKAHTLTGLSVGRNLMIYSHQALGTPVHLYSHAII